MPYLHITLDKANTNVAEKSLVLSQQIVSDTLVLRHAAVHTEDVVTFANRNMYIDLGFAAKKVQEIAPVELASRSLVIPLTVGANTTQINMDLDIGLRRSRIPTSFRSLVFDGTGAKYDMGNDWEVHLYFEYSQKSLF